MPLKKSFACLALCCIVALVGCVRGKTYRATVPMETVPARPAFPSDHSQLQHGSLCNVAYAPDLIQPCLTYIELDDFGELRVRDASTGVASQVEDSISLIHAAKSLPEGSQDKSQPIILVFVHGWKHNASGAEQYPEDANVQGIKEYLDMLALHYPTALVHPNGSACQTGEGGCIHVYHPIVGVYVGWRGEAVSQFWPVTRTFSYFDRESAAYRVGNTSLTAALTRISEAAHPDGSDEDPYQPMLLMMGHSFGGLVLERTLAQAFMERLTTVQEQEANGVPLAKTKARFADLIVYINTAVVASDSKQVIDQFAENRFFYQQASNDKRFPVIVSISSSSDQATLTAVGIGHLLPTQSMRLTGSIRKKIPMACLEPEYGEGNGRNSTITDFTQADFFTRTAPHFEALQSHQLIQVNEDSCNRRDLLDDPKIFPLGGETMSPTDPGNYVRSQAKKDSFGPTALMGGSCYLIVPKNSQSKDSPRCNGTSYFVMEVPPAIVPDHGTIFTGRLFELLKQFLVTSQLGSENPSAPQPGRLNMPNLVPSSATSSQRSH